MSKYILTSWIEMGCMHITKNWVLRLHFLCLYAATIRPNKITRSPIMREMIPALKAKMQIICNVYGKISECPYLYNMRKIQQ